MTADIYHPTTAGQTPFTDDETRSLESVRMRFQQDHNVLSEREREYLHWLARSDRWLVRSDRIAS
jgi:hypothetical protein